MLNRLTTLPLGLMLLITSAVAMLAPVPLAVVEREWATGRSFLYSGLILLVLCVMLGIATHNRVDRRPVRAQLSALLVAFLVLPLVLAVPLYESQPEARFLDCYFEMVSSITTTGATVFDAVDLNMAEHFWRALVAWLGGFLMWIAALAILAPLNLGGFEIIGRDGKGPGHNAQQIASISNYRQRINRSIAALFPVYLGLTMVLWLGLVILGEDGFVAICHAMSILATSGISPLERMDESGAGVGGEGIMLLFLVFALSRRSFTRDGIEHRLTSLRNDPELRLGLLIIALVTGVIFLRHFVGAIESDSIEVDGDAIRALWGGLFTVASFLTNTGFESADWQASQSWSRLETPGLIFMGLAMIGGGVATTAGGVKLLRVYVLYRHAQRELERLVHPSSVGGYGATARSERRRGAYMAWIFFMLLAISIAAVMLALAFFGIGFEPAVILTVAALSNTGPLAQMAGDIPIFYATLPDAAKSVLVFAMVLGRMETLALIALFNPDFWRR